MILLHQKASPRALRIVECWIFSIWFLNVVFDPLTSLAQMPGDLYRSTGILQFFYGDRLLWPQSFGFLIGLKTSLIMVLILVLLNRGRPITTFLAAFLLTVYQTLVRSFGHLNHPELMLLLSTYVLSLYHFIPKRVLESFDRKEHDKTSSGVVLTILLFIFTMTYCFAGVHRVIVGFPDMFVNDTLVSWIVENSKRFRLVNWNLDWMVTQIPVGEWMMKIGFPLVTVAEILAPFTLASRWMRYFFLIVIIPFHIMVWLFMGIFFWQNLALYVLFMDWTHLVKKRTHA